MYVLCEALYHSAIDCFIRAAASSRAVLGYIWHAPPTTPVSGRPPQHTRTAACAHDSCCGKPTGPQALYCCNVWHGIPLLNKQMCCCFKLVVAHQGPQVGVGSWMSTDILANTVPVAPVQAACVCWCGRGVTSLARCWFRVEGRHDCIGPWLSLSVGWLALWQPSNECNWVIP